MKDTTELFLSNEELTRLYRALADSMESFTLRLSALEHGIKKEYEKIGGE